MQTLIAKSPAVLTQFDFEGNTLLYTAVADGVDSNAPNAAGDTPLAAALRGDRNQLPMIRSLLQSGGAADRLLPEGGNALHVAARLRRNDRRVLTLLARNHIAVHARNARGQTPLQVARESGAADVVQILADAG